MIPLPSSFRLRGFDWRIVQREGDIAIVEQNKHGWTNPALNVVIIQKHKARKLPNGEMTIDAEGLPSWEQWGQQAWTCGDMADAKRRFNNLVDAANGPPCEYVSGKTGGPSSDLSNRGSSHATNPDGLSPDMGQTKAVNP